MFQWLQQGFFGNRIIQHLIFWVSIVAFFSILYGSFNEDYYNQLRLQLLYLPAKIIPTYITLYLLMPRFLLKEQYSQFVVWIMIVLLLSGFLHWAIAYNVERPFLAENPDWGPFWSAAKIIKYVTHVYPYVLIAFTIKFLKHWYKEQKKTQDIFKEKLEAELKFLKTQLHPHFLFNTLNNLYALTLKKADAAPQLVLKLSDLMDYMLYECDANRVPLEREVQFVRNYFEIERLRYGDRLKVDIEINGDLRNRDIAPLIFLPFLENAFKHGISTDLDDAWIKFILTVDTQFLVMELRNSKPKTSMELPKNNGIGLQNVKRRLLLQYGEGNYTLTTEGTSTFFSIKLKLPHE